MKPKLLNSLRLRLCLLVAFVLCAGGNAWATDLNLTFDVSSNPGDWPTSSSAGNYTYTLDGVNYTFALGANVYCNSGYLMLKYTTSLGIPAIEGYKLTKVVASNSKGCSTGTKVGVSSSSSSASYITGGAIQTWSTTGSTYTYNLSSTEANTVYYLYVTNKNAQVTELKLTYEPTKPSAGLTFGDYEEQTYNVLPNADFAGPTLSNPNSLTVTYSSSNSAIASVNANTGAVQIGTTEGTATITASSAEDDTYAAGSATYTINVQKGASTVTLSNDALTFNIVDGTTQTLTATAKYNETTLDDPAITWESSNTNVATVSGGVVTPVAPGTATITASYAGTVVYENSYSTCAVTVNKANTTLTLNTNEGSIDLKNIGARTFTLTPTVKAIKTDETQVAVVSPTVTWTSSDETVATVVDGVVTGLKVGETTITARYDGGTNYNAATNATCSIEVNDTRDAVNIESFTAANSTIIIGGTPNTTATTVTNNQNGWEEAYNYTSSNTDVATVAANGTVTAVAKGTATITVTLNVDADDSDYKEGTTTSKTLEITVTKPFHNVTFSSNGSTFGTPSSVEEGEDIELPATNPEDIDGMTFVGWTATTISGTTDDTPTFVTSPQMGSSDVIYYAVFAESSQSYSDNEIETSPSQTLQYDTWTYSGSTTDKTSYRLFHTGSDIESATFDLSLLKKVVVTGGTFGGTDNNSLTIGDGTNTWKSVTVSGKSESGENIYTDGTALSGNGKLHITCNSGTESSTGVRIKKIQIYLKKLVTTYSSYCTTLPDKQDLDLSFANDLVRLKTSDGTYTQAVTVTPSTYDGTISYSVESSSTSLGAYINSSSGVVSFSNIGSVIVKATAPPTATYKGGTATYTIYVQTTPTFEVSNKSIAQGESYSLDTSGYACGEVTLTTDNSAIGSVSELVITGSAVGVATITVATAESDKYEAGLKTFTLTVTAPEAATTNTSRDPIFYESFDTNAGAGGNDGKWDGSSGMGGTQFDNSWTTTGSTGGANQCIKLASGSKSGSITTPALNTTSGVTYTMTFKAGSWKDESSTLTITGNKTGSFSPNSFALQNERFNTYTVTFTATGSNATITFSAASSNRLFLDEVLITKPLEKTSVTTSGGVATYCYQYPLDLSSLTGAKAYKVSSVDTDNNKVMLEQITGEVKGGVPFILKSDDGSDDSFEITLADESDVVPANNALVGTLAPTFVTQTNEDYTNFAYSKSKYCFVKLGENGNTIPANRAYLPINLGGGLAKSFILSFDDADGITETMQMGGNENNAIYNLAGQRLNKVQKGINIINGKKVLVK